MFKNPFESMLRKKEVPHIMGTANKYLMKIVKTANGLRKKIWRQFPSGNGWIDAHQFRRQHFGTFSPIKKIKGCVYFK